MTNIYLLAYTRISNMFWNDMHDSPNNVASQVCNLIEETQNKWMDSDTCNLEADLLAEVAGRLCYLSFDKPNPKTADTRSYLANILKQMHYSVLEHASASFLIVNCSRSLTHELIRHRHFSYSQTSQRYVNNLDVTVLPPLFEGDEPQAKEARRIIDDLEIISRTAYTKLQTLGQGLTDNKKRVREAARCVLPNMTGTNIIVSGNHRSWREFIQKRATLHADAEMREIAVSIFEKLQILAPGIYQDMRLTTKDDLSYVEAQENVLVG